ncbi:hypothetical protein PHYBLDRAFT_73050, partial [Phycomyces blakesleeanus NRRL 1555(-)]
KELDRLDLIPELNSWLDKEPKPLKPATCLITGQPAIYRDPSTMVPFSNKETFGVIRACENHEMRWSPNLGVYLGRLTGATGVPDGWDQMIAGKAMGEPDWVNKNGNPARPSWMRAYGEPCPKKSLETKRTMDTKRHAGSPGPSTVLLEDLYKHENTDPTFLGSLTNCDGSVKDTTGSCIENSPDSKKLSISVATMTFFLRHGLFNQHEAFKKKV